MYFIIGADKKEYGPVSAEDIRNWIKQRRANSQTNARHEDGDWQPLTEFPEFSTDLRVPTEVSVTPTPDPTSEYKQYESNAYLPETSQRAVAALILGILSATLCCWCPFFHPIAITLGGVAISDINQSPEELKGKGIAITGVVLGILGLVILVGINLANFAALADAGNFQEMIDEIKVP